MKPKLLGTYMLRSKQQLVDMEAKMEDMIKKQPLQEFLNKKNVDVKSMKNIENLALLTNDKTLKPVLGHLDLSDSDVEDFSDDSVDFYGKSKLQKKETATSRL